MTGAGAGDSMEERSRGVLAIQFDQSIRHEEQGSRERGAGSLGAGNWELGTGLRDDSLVRSSATSLCLFAPSAVANFAGGRQSIRALESTRRVGQRGRRGSSAGLRTGEGNENKNKDKKTQDKIITANHTILD